MKKMSSHVPGTRRLSSIIEDDDWCSKKAKIKKESNGCKEKSSNSSLFVRSLSNDSGVCEIHVKSEECDNSMGEESPDPNDSGIDSSPYLMGCDSAQGGSNSQKLEDVNLDYVVRTEEVNKPDESVDCHDCMMSKSIAPFVECQVCRRSIDVDEKYREYQGYVACQACFNNRSKKGPLTFNTGSSSKDIPRGRFEIRNNFITISEPVVECTLCERKFHRVCVNYPEPTTSSTYLKSEFVCKSCEEKYHILPICISLPVSLSAQSISHTTLSKYMEQRIQAIFPMTPEILIRVASNVPKKYTVEGSLGKYFDKRQPDFPYMAKTISCFQLNERKKYHLIFVLYVQEYDQDCPEPNRNTIYISVLDSVRLFKPAESRTQMFHLVLLTYFDYMRKCGFKQIFLWSCPPGGSGMDYVFYRKPRCQPIITADLLNNWYRRLFAVGLDMNILAKFSTLNDWAAQEIRSMEDFKEKFPFFEGDHWPDEVAKLIDRINKTETPEDWIFKNLQSKLARNKNSFYVLTLNPTPAKNYYRNDVIILSALADNRDRLVKFFRSNYLEFEDIRKATYATQALVLQIALEQLGSTLESMGFNCNQCNKGIRNGHACMECEYRVCNECGSSNEHQHNRLKEIVLPIRIPNLFTEEYKWNNFKDTILGSSIQNVNSGVGRLAVATKDTTIRIRHCSECTWDLCEKCMELRREMWDLLQLANVKFPNDLTKMTDTTIRAVYQR